MEGVAKRWGKQNGGDKRDKDRNGRDKQRGMREIEKDK